MANDLEDVEVEEVLPMNGELKIYQQDKAILNSQIETAKRYPRSLKRAISNAITLVTMDEEIAAKMTYSLRKGGKNITGPSVNLAKVMAQVYGNMRIENKVIGYDATHVTCSATCFDLENNFAIRTEIKKSIVGKDGRYSEDMCTIAGNAGNAIALRNAVFAVIPQNIIDKVYNEALKTITGNLSDSTKLATRCNLLVDGFITNYQNKKLTEEEVLKSVGKLRREHITEKDIVTLIGFEKALATGEMNFDSIFRPTDTPVIRMPPKTEDKSEERILLMISEAKDRKALEKLKKDAGSEAARLAYDAKWAELK